MKTEERTPAQLLRSPVGFASGILGLRLYPWQAKILSWYDQIRPDKVVRGAVSTPNGAGKSRVIIGPMALAHLARFPLGRVVITSKDARQLDSQVFASISQFRHRLPSSWRFLEREVRTPTGGLLVGFTTDEETRAEGWHPQGEDGPLLMITDEAKSVPDKIHDAFDRCSPQASLLISSPGPRRGRFFQAHTKFAALYHRMRVGLADCPHISADKIEYVIRKHGADSPLVKSMLHGEFMDEDEGEQFPFPLELLQGALESPAREQLGATYAFCDFAAGGDENVLALKTGNRVTIAAAWRDRDTMRGVGRFILEFRKHKLTPDRIFCDGGGLGKPMADRMAEVGWPIHREHNGSKPWNPHYANRGAEIWHECAGMLRRGEIILPLEDPETWAQLSSRRSDFTSSGKLGIQSKDDMKDEGLPSPDRADAVCGVAVCGRQIAVIQAGRPAFDQQPGTGPDSTNYPPGMDAGY